MGAVGGQTKELEEEKNGEIYNRNKWRRRKERIRWKGIDSGERTITENGKRR